VYSLFWPRFNTTGALFSMYGGLALAVGLIVFSPVVSGSETSMISGTDFSFFPLNNPGIVSIPAAFLLGIVGTYLGRPSAEHDTKQAEMEVRALTGAGAEKAVQH
jgi:cation/acetate symporter